MLRTRISLALGAALRAIGSLGAADLARLFVNDCSPPAEWTTPSSSGTWHRARRANIEEEPSGGVQFRSLRVDSTSNLMSLKRTSIGPPAWICRPKMPRRDNFASSTSTHSLPLMYVRTRLPLATIS
jgi:hypothetical protein